MNAVIRVRVHIRIIHYFCTIISSLKLYKHESRTECTPYKNQIETKMKLCIVLAVLLSVILLDAGATPTFDRIAEVLLDALDDGPHYARPVAYAPVHTKGPYGPVHPSGPLIEEGYDHGYDYYYGGGSAHGNGVFYGNPYPQGPPVQGYYPPRPVQGPVKGYYSGPQYPYAYAPSAPNYVPEYRRSSVKGPATVGGYKEHGY